MKINELHSFYQMHDSWVIQNENRSKITISAETKEEADTLFYGLSAGGIVEMPITDSPWGSYFGAFRDKYGIEWMVTVAHQL